jgi:hypothetical protein
VSAVAINAGRWGGCCARTRWCTCAVRGAAGRMAYYRLAGANVRMLLDAALTHIGHALAAAHPEHDTAPGDKA